jgi:hypothetical protein
MHTISPAAQAVIDIWLAGVADDDSLTTTVVDALMVADIDPGTELLEPADFAGTSPALIAA